jgi:hypothetical protein
MPEFVHVVDRLGNTTFALRPEYDSVVQDLGYLPPQGVPVECTFEWAWDAAVQKVARENRQEEARKTPPIKKAAPAKKAATGASEATPADTAEQAVKAVTKAVAKRAAPRSRR